MAPRVTILVGCAGSGKSTYARQEFPKALVVSADHYFERLAKRTRQAYEDVFDTWQLRSAHSECQERFVKAIAAERRTVIVDNTNVRKADRQRYIKIATDHGCETELHVFSPWIHGEPALSQDQIDSYVALCHRRTTHCVPWDTVFQQFGKLDLPSGIYLAGKPPEFLRPLTFSYKQP